MNSKIKFRIQSNRSQKMQIPKKLANAWAEWFSEPYANYFQIISNEHFGSSGERSMNDGQQKRFKLLFILFLCINCGSRCWACWKSKSVALEYTYVQIKVKKLRKKNIIYIVHRFFIYLSFLILFFGQPLWLALDFHQYGCAYQFDRCP